MDIKSLHLPDAVDKQMVKESIKNYSGVDYTNKNCLDIGGNVGGFVLVAKEGGAHIVKSFEPDIRNFGVLKINTSDLEDVEIFQSCISNQLDDKLKVFKSPSLSNHASSRIFNGTKRFAEFCECDNVHLVDAIDSFDRLDVLKMDIEGYEEFLFKDKECFEAITSVNELFIEFHINKSTKDFMFETVEKLKKIYSTVEIKEIFYFGGVKGLDCYFKK
jgi:FkbM family methyltransferase